MMTHDFRTIELTHTTACELWREARAEVLEEIPIDAPADDQVLAYLCAEYLNRELGLSGKERCVYHTENCRYRPVANYRLVEKRSTRECYVCSGENMVDQLVGADAVTGVGD